MEPIDDTSGDGTSLSLADVLAILQLQRGVIVGAIVVGVSIAALYSALAPRQYRAMAVVQIAPIAAKEINTDGVVTDLTASWNRNIDIATKLAILQSKTLARTVFDRYQALQLEEGAGAAPSTPGELLESLQVDQRKGTELIDIRVTTSHPVVSATLANLTAREFSEEALNANVEAARAAQEWLQQQLVEYERRIADATRALNDFERENNLAGSSSDAETSLASRMGSLNEAYGDLNTQVVLQETLVENYERLRRKGAIDALAKEMATPMIESLLARYAMALAEHARVAAIYGEKMPEFRHARAALDAVEADLRTEVDKTLAAERAKLDILKSKRDNLVEAIGSGKDQILALQSIWAEYDRKRTELASAKSFYERLRSRMGELELQAQTQFNRIRVIEEATPPKKAAYPIIPANLFIGLVLGSLAGFGIAFLREWFDDTISSPVEVNTYLRVPFLGVVPMLTDVTEEQDKALYSHHKPQSAVAEAVRGVRTVLDLNPISVPKRLLVTSAISAEGKTSTAVRLAIAYANSNRRVLLIDCDLRRPRVHKVFDLQRGPGLTSLILGGRCEEAVASSGIPNLDILPCGHKADRPDELLTSPALPRVLDELSEMYDVVLIDSPPSVIVADARLLSRHVDGVVVVVREQVTARSVIRDAITGLQQVKANIYGVVINAVDFNKRRTTYKYYGYGYGYRYEEEPAEAAAS